MNISTNVRPQYRESAFNNERFVDLTPDTKSYKVIGRGEHHERNDAGKLWINSLMLSRDTKQANF